MVIQTDLCVHWGSAHLNVSVWMGGVKTMWFEDDGIYEEPEMFKFLLYLRVVKHSSEEALLLAMPSLIFSRKNVVTTFGTPGLSSLSRGTKTRLSSFSSKHMSLLPYLTIIFWNAHISKELLQYHLYQHLGAIFILLHLYVGILTALRKWTLLNCTLKEAAKFALMSF